MLELDRNFNLSANSLVIRDQTRPWRWFDAFGDVEKALIDGVWKADEATVTASGTSPIAASLVPGATALITTGATEYDGDNIQIVGSRFKLEAGKPLSFGARLTVSDATQCDLLFGLAGIDTTLTAASAGHALAVGAGFAGFTKLDEVTAGYFKTVSTATEKNSAAAFTLDTSPHIYEMFWDGTLLRAYIDDVLIATFGSNITTEVLTPSLAFRTGAAAAKTCTLHWMRTIQLRS